MPLDNKQARELLAKGELRKLFIEELGWDRHSAGLTVTVGESTLTLDALAQKRGMIAYQCPTPAGQRVPDSAYRRKIEHQVAKSAHEHLIVFTDAERKIQIWQWVKREVGKPVACREHHFHRFQPGDALLQKLEAIAFTLDEEEQLSLTDVTRRARSGFDVERLTKRFYDRFQKEHAVFLKLISGITETADQEWYASVMLNRLMFVYFIQRKGFLAGDREYLRIRLAAMQAEHGKDKFYSFYRHFLLRLFHEGLGNKIRKPELDRLLGQVPYLNGGLFDIHELEKPERYGKVIQIPDKAFERIFDYFDQYQWHLDERPLRADNEINPDVLGYIFEKYINQKQMGAYYTKEDITEYISKNTVLPFLFDAARVECKVAFENPNGPTLWDLLKNAPDRYIYSAVRHGVENELPKYIAPGVCPPTLKNPVGVGPVPTLELRKGWNKAALPEFALPTETWREVVARRGRYEEVRRKLAAGEIRDINDLITLNLDIRQFVQDVIENCEGPELLRAFWHTIEKITILDPTCGSGAFLFAALNILEPLYEACLDRMEAFVEDQDRLDGKPQPERLSDFRKVLERVAAHPNRRYFIFKSIIINNLFGVDIMEEAVEICKLRLFLKLAAQVEPDMARPNLGIEPLPDIDFNIRAGNTLVGYATYEEARRAITSKIDFANTAGRVATQAAGLQEVFDAFRARQVEGDGSVPAEQKRELRSRLKGLEDELNRYLAGQYGVDPSKKSQYVEWLNSHQPFHWFIDFYGIVHVRGGFDVIIGNPPYVEYGKVKKDYSVRSYKTEACGNLYAFVMERNAVLVRKKGRTGMIVPHSAICTDRMAPVQKFIGPIAVSTWISTYGIRPAKLFVGVDQRLCIYVTAHAPESPAIFTSRYHRWNDEFRSHLLYLIRYASTKDVKFQNSIPKVCHPIELKLLHKIKHFKPLMNYSSVRGTHEIFYHNAPRYWVRAMDFAPYFWNERDGEKLSTHVKKITLPTKQNLTAVVAALNSSLFYWWFLMLSDCRDLNIREIELFPVGLEQMSGVTQSLLMELSQFLMENLKKNKYRKECEYKATGKVIYDEFYPKHSKPILDKIDAVLARHYGFTEEELDFIINYDIKYRMGVEDEDEES